MNKSLIAILFLLFGCVENFNPEINSNAANLIYLDGLITDQEPARVTIGKTIPFGSVISDETDLIRDAIVILIENGEEFEELIVQSDGSYLGSLNGRLNQEYEIEVTLSDGGIIRSKPEIIAPSPGVGELSLSRKRKDLIGVNGGIRDVRGLEVNHYMNEETKTQYFRWKLEGTYKFIAPLNATSECYVEDNYGSYFVIKESASSEKDILSNTLIFLEGTSVFFRGYSLEVTQYGLSRTSFNYWKNIDDQKNNVGSVFDSPPAAIIGNLYYEMSDKKVLGFFDASSVNTQRIFIAASEFAEPPVFPAALCVPNAAGAEPPEWCSDCETLANSTTEIPSYWCETCE